MVIYYSILRENTDTLCESFLNKNGSKNSQNCLDNS